MAILSTLYSEKVITEHPVSFWMLNDTVDYVSLTTESNREFQSSLKWTASFCTPSTVSSNSTTPFPNSISTRILCDVPLLGSQTSLVSIADLPEASIKEELGNFMIGIWYKTTSNYVKRIYLGYQYYDPISLSTKEELQYTDIDIADKDSWLFTAKTFDLIPAEYEDVKVLIKFDIEVGGASSADYEVFLNGYTLGQWAENFAQTSLGITTSAIPSSIALDSGLKVVTAPYSGPSGSNAYYISDGSELFCKNFGVPIVYGSDTITKIYENTDVAGAPSLIFPGYGFLNQKGKYNTYTAEMWVRINADASEEEKIFGPIASNDGLYIEGPFIKLVIGKSFRSYYVGKWFRPMLIHIRYQENNATLLINGEEVISLEFSTEDLDFPSEFDNNNKSQDWLGFYAYPDIHPIELDSFAIYSYYVPDLVAKRRYVWGQGIQAPEITNAGQNAVTAFIDYAYADYKVNYHYPDFANWKQAYLNNINASQNALILPEYSLPAFGLGSSSYDSWIDGMKSAQSSETSKYLSFTGLSGTPSLLFNNLNVLNDRVRSFYGIYKFKNSYNTTTGSEIFWLLKNEITKDQLKAHAVGNSIRFTATINGSSFQVGEDIEISDVTKKVVVGIDIPTLSLSEYNLVGFLSDYANLSLKIGSDGINTMEGKLYKFVFDSGYNNKKIISSYSENPDGLFSYYNSGTETYTQDKVVSSVTKYLGEELMSHTGNYTLVAREKHGTFYIDIDQAGYWQDYMPLSYFSKQIEDYNGNTSYDLDQLQFNIDHPQPTEKLAIEYTDSWTYQELFNRYRDPIDQTYADLDNSLYSGWDNYEDMQEQSTKYRYYDTESSAVRSYVSFQQVVLGSTKDLIDLTTKAKPLITNVVDPDSVLEEWETSAYEVVNGMVVYPPTKDSNDIDIDYNDLLLVYHLDFNIKDTLRSPLRLRNLQISSQVYERTDFTAVGTKYGNSIYPYSKTGFYYNFKAKNPLEIYKGSTPHLYLTRDTGIEVHGSFSPVTDRGFIFAVNPQVSQQYSVSSIQAWIKFSDDEFPTGPTKIFTIDSKDEIIDIYLQGDQSTQRGYIYALNRSTGQRDYSVEFHINGIPTDLPFIDNEEWAVIGMAFNNLLNFNGYAGQIKANGPLLYNNLSYYIFDPLEAIQSAFTRSWGQVAEDLWSDWNTSSTWTQVRNIGTTNIYRIDPSEIYSRYIGTNRIVIDDTESANSAGLTVNPEILKIYKDSAVYSYTKKAV